MKKLLFMVFTGFVSVSASADFPRHSKNPSDWDRPCPRPKQQWLKVIFREGDVCSVHVPGFEESLRQQWQLPCEVESVIEREGARWLVGWVSWREWPDIPSRIFRRDVGMSKKTYDPFCIPVPGRDEHVF